MNTPVKILLWIIGILFIAIGIMCYQVGHNAFTNYLYFMTPMVALRLLRAIQLINLDKK